MTSCYTSGINVCYHEVDGGYTTQYVGLSAAQVGSQEVKNQHRRMNMTTITSQTTQVPVIVEREAVAGELQALLVDLVDLAL